ncbi:LysR family transcriptional regulator [Pseudoduganella umbonata]|uniref:DNA-binding transcriptional LysR family regulator n=1 Tax=Pseudoduganella umbonata TaxID=864828 RepID=A0A4P8HR68_9BURK|nr:LysR family transcriptional regulator [Pseudoduganella umbonata]MBB3222478.1 DNA-binding transcriptional LysR family regulator [Pseudoduganella umbonata]QCP10984.1 LysR family transcriptional regulator [Pseudoduganella umbonata]
MDKHAIPRPPPNLNLLRSLDVLLDTRNLTAAAGVLGLTQSTLSRQLAQLRSQFGDPLLVREGQRFLLTERARALRTPLKVLLESLDAVLSEPVFDPAACTRRFAIAGSDYLADHMLPVLVEAIGREAPRAEIAFRLWEPGYYRLLSDEGIDLVATIADTLPDNLHGRAMGKDRPVCAMRAEHPLACQDLALADYLQWPHLRVTGGSDKDSFVDQYLAASGLRRHVRAAVPFFSSALRIAGNDDLLWTLPEHMAITLSRQAPLVWKPLPFYVPDYQYWLLWHARSHHDPVHQWFRRHVFRVLHGFDHGVTQYGMQAAHGSHAPSAIVGKVAGP